MLKESEKTFSLLQKSLDAVLIFSGWLLAYYLRFNLIPDGQKGLFDDFFKVGLTLVVVSYFIFEKNKLYTSHRFSSRFDEIFKALKANTVSFLILIVILYFLKFERLSRIHLLLYFVISSSFLIISRVAIRKLLKKIRRKGKNLRHVLLVGDGKNLLEYLRVSRLYRDSGISFIGWIDAGENLRDPDIDIISSSYSDFIKETRPDNVVVSYSNENAKRFSEFLKNNYNDVIPLQVLPDLSYSMVGHHIEDFAGIPLLTFNQPSFSSIDLIFKRLFDIISTGIGLLIISPLMIAIAIGVKLSSSGPIFFAQERIGLNGKKFKMWKFRSMRVALTNEDQTTWSSKEDPRKTKFGSFIRSTSLDELPQLWNVLIGEMSLVGPRPERPFFVEKFKDEIPHYMLRHKMKAGITGWAQVNGWRGDTDLTKRIECDIFYIRNWSFWLDIKIIFLTFLKGFINKNAY